MRKIVLFLFFVPISFFAQDWAGIPVPADAGTGKMWELQSDISDDFNYKFDATNALTTFGGKWKNFYHNNWTGPGPTIWDYRNTSVSGSELEIKASRITGETKSYSTGIANPATDTKPATRAGCITSTRKVLYPVFVEARVKVANAVMASDIWMLSPDDTQEIDILECYGGSGVDNRNSFFSKNIHLSHHMFIRNPFTDYQPADTYSWYEQTGVTSWGTYPNYVRIGVYWKSPTHIEYYIDGKLVRILSDKAFASLDKNGVWHYTYPTGVTNGAVNRDGTGYQAVNSASSLDAANAASITSVIDPMNYSGTKSITKELEIIINMEDQNWNAYQGRTPTNEEIANAANHTFKIDWIRIYKPVASSTSVPVTGATLSPATITLVAGTTTTLTGAVTPTNASDQTMTFSSSNTAIATVNASGLVTAMSVGTATITATTTDGAKIATTAVNVTNSSGNTLIIEAESFSSTGGTFVESANPNGGVSKEATIISYVNAGDWVDYSFNVPKAGKYKIVYFISTPSNNAQIKVSFDGKDFSTDDVTNNGSWGTFVALVAKNEVSFTAGVHTMRLLASGSNDWQWNLDRIELQEAILGIDDFDTPLSQVTIYPNPASDHITISGYELNQLYKVTIYNQTGKLVQIIDGHNIPILIKIDNLPKGTYFLNLEGTHGNKVFKFIKTNK
ncbi:carbohydrate-binding protein [Flavobacterium sp.]|uniref:carbohydrate-binding protein n=1 Tax=Flavobacterium sp. TaxID=239 RepID=UPI003C369D81